MARNTAVKPQGPAQLPKGGPSPRAAGTATKGSGNNPRVVGVKQTPVGKRASNGS